MAQHTLHTFPASRIATRDVCAVSLKKHHIVSLLEVDVSLVLKAIEKLKTQEDVSFTAWLIKVIALTLQAHEMAAAYRAGKNKAIRFHDINVSIVVEKEINGHHVPMPLIIQNAGERSVTSITHQIRDAQEKKLSEKDIVLQQQSSRWEHLYYLLPGFLRRRFWYYLLSHPHLAFKKMGNVAITSVGMIGRATGWFIPLSVHPVCFGIGHITRKPVVIVDAIEIRDILPLTVLLDHDVIDGANMARFISDLIANMEKGVGVDVKDYAV